MYICRVKKIINFVIIISVFLLSCRRPEQYSDIPEIKLISFEKYKDMFITTDDTITINGAYLTFYFQDGDGDIGLNESDNYPPFDTSSLYQYNFFCDYYEKQNGIFEKVDTIETPTGRRPFILHARFPRLSNLPEESIHGEFYLNMSMYYNTFSHFDTIQLKFYIVDRKLNHSNVEEITVIR
jgi:hypothetical protein